MSFIVLSLKFLVLYDQDKIVSCPSTYLALEMAATTEALSYSSGYIKLLPPSLHGTYQYRCKQLGELFSLYATMWQQLHCAPAGPQCLFFEDTICKSETRFVAHAVEFMETTSRSSSVVQPFETKRTPSDVLEVF